MAIILDFFTRKVVEKKVKAIQDRGDKYVVFIPTCYKRQTIFHTQTYLNHHEPNEPTMAERVLAIDELSKEKPVEVLEYLIGTLYDISDFS